MKALGKWLELLQLLLTETGFCSDCSSTNARLDAAIFGEGLVLVTSGDISCFRQSGRDCRGSEVVAASAQVGERMKMNGEHEWNVKLKVKCQKHKREWLQDTGTVVQQSIKDADGKSQRESERER